MPRHMLLATIREAEPWTVLSVAAALVLFGACAVAFVRALRRR